MNSLIYDSFQAIQDGKVTMKDLLEWQQEGGYFLDSLNKQTKLLEEEIVTQKVGDKLLNCGILTKETIVFYHGTNTKITDKTDPYFFTSICLDIAENFGQYVYGLRLRSR